MTVTRQYASGGSDVARLVAKALGWTLIDNEFVDQVARLAGLPPDEVAQREERSPGLLERLARTLAVASPEMFITTAGTPPPVDADEDAIVKMTERVIAEAAAEGRVVLVGRGAQAYLAARDKVLHVFLAAPTEVRVTRTMERLKIDRKEAERTVERTDRERREYVKTYYGRGWGEPSNYDLTINTDRFKYAEVVELIADALKKRGWL